MRSLLQGGRGGPEGGANSSPCSCNCHMDTGFFLFSFCGVFGCRYKNRIYIYIYLYKSALFLLNRCGGKALTRPPRGLPPAVSLIEFAEVITFPDELPLRQDESHPIKWSLSRDLHFLMSKHGRDWMSGRVLPGGFGDDWAPWKGRWRIQRLGAASPHPASPTDSQQLMGTSNPHLKKTRLPKTAGAGRAPVRSPFCKTLSRDPDVPCPRGPADLRADLWVLREFLEL